MTIQYENQGFNLTATTTTTILTAPTTGRLLIKQIQATNGSNGALSLVTQIVDTSASSAVFRIGNQSIPANSTLDIITNVLVLEEGDIIKMTCSTANEIQGIISYALLDRSQENG
tara:strand:+ start:1420 stop:1764 length:345 start_codon:yes stop_codon:yes gene_type:complete